MSGTTSRSLATHDEFLQGRVRLLLTAFLWVTVVLLLFMVAEVVVTGRSEIGKAGFYLLLGTVAWIALGRSVIGETPRSALFVHAVEDFVAIGMAVAVALVVEQTPIGYRPELSLLLVYAVMLFGRAALVPSTATQTALLCAAYSIPLAIVSWRTYVGFESPGPGYPHQTSLGVTLFIEVWWFVISAVAVGVSRVIYGLRREVTEAQQLGQYMLERKIGEGGMGAVYQARHAMLRRPTAVKLINPEQTTEQAVARFEREVQLTAQLTHPHTITVFDYGRTETGIFYYAMELLDGATLAEIVAIDGPQPAGRVARVLTQVADALSEAHEIGLIHRDIKPANVMLTRQGSDLDAAKVLDFGLVRDLHAEGDAELTQENAIQGTPLYMAPETIAASGEAGAKSDLYGLGAVGYFLLTGEHVFSGATIVEVCSHHLHSTPVPPSERLGGAVPADLEQLVLSCLAKDPAERPATARELARRLSQCEGEPWTQEMAAAWWQETRGALQASRVRPDEVSETVSRTIRAADMAGR
ncbi:MAG: serine/threonine-protein kinase [Myxococcota bacterium]